MLACIGALAPIARGCRTSPGCSVAYGNIRRLVAGAQLTQPASVSVGVLQRAGADNNAARMPAVTRQPSLRRGTWIIVNPLNQLETLSPLRSGDDHIHLPATAPGTDKPLAPLENRHIRAVSSSRQGRARRAGRASCTTRSVEREPQRRCPASSADPCRTMSLPAYRMRGPLPWPMNRSPPPSFE